MKVTILGSGVIGVVSAYYLARAGYQVTVLDRQAAPGLETSFANAGQISPGYATPWAAPGVPMKALKWMFQEHAPLAVRLDGSLFQLQWMFQMLMNCTSSAYDLNKERMLRVAEYSRDCLKTLRAETGIAYEGRQGGTLQVFRTLKQLEAAQKDIRILKSLGIAHELIDATSSSVGKKRLVELEPGLVSTVSQLTGALQLPGDETGDCHIFTQEFAKRCVAMGVKFRYGVIVDGIEKAGGVVTGVMVNGKLERTQQLVVALGSFSRAQVLNLGLKIPVYPLKGYSLTVPIQDVSKAPVSTVMDETFKVAVTRFDDRIRIGGMAEVAGFDYRLAPKRQKTLEHVVEGLFPGASTLAEGKFWTGLRPMTPDGTPIIGATPLKNLWLNTGHGTLGWTMACGSGKLLSDLMTGAKPQISADGLAMNRYARNWQRKGTDNIGGLVTGN
jgi:D-amino-acid dehydrogenase